MLSGLGSRNINEEKKQELIDTMIAEADAAAEGKAESYTMDQVFE